MHYTSNTLWSICFLLFISCQTKTQNTEREDEPKEITVSLEKVWESDTVLRTAESVIYDSESDVLYVSCINGTPPTAKDNDGFIAKISATDGSVLTANWATGMHAPKGMGIYKGSLFVADIDRVLQLELSSGDLIKEYPIDEATFLNDITIDDKGVVYISDSDLNKIYMISDGEVAVWREVEGRANGLLADGDKMMLATSSAGILYEIDFDTKEINAVEDSIPRGDGIIKINDDYIVSSWIGEVRYVSATLGEKKILDTKAEKSNAADIEFIKDQNMLLVPTFFGNRVVAYKVNP